MGDGVKGLTVIEKYCSISRPSSSHWCHWSVAARSAPVVDLPLVNPQWLSERGQYSCRWWSRTFRMWVSSSLLSTESNKMGRYFAGSGEGGSLRDGWDTCRVPFIRDFTKSYGYNIEFDNGRCDAQSCCLQHLSRDIVMPIGFATIKGTKQHVDSLFCIKEIVRTVIRWDI